MSPEILTLIKDYGIPSGLFALCIIEFFKLAKQYISENKLKTTETEKKSGTDEVVAELKLQNENHLEHIQQGISNGFQEMSSCQNNSCKEIVKAINDLHLDLVKEIKNLK